MPEQFEFTEEPQPQDHSGPVLDDTTQTIDLPSLDRLSSSGSYITEDINFQKFMDLMPNIILLIDEIHLIRAYSHKTEEYMRAGETDLINVSLSSLTKDRQTAEILSKVIQQVFDKKQSRVIETLLMIGKKAIWTKITLSPVRSNGDRMVMCVIQDLSKEKITEQKLKREQNRLVETQAEAAAAAAKVKSVQLVREIAAGVAHNFNNVLQVVHGAATLIKISDDKDKIAKYADQVTDAAESGAATVKRLADYARSMSYQGERKSIDISKLVENSIEYARPFWHSSSRLGGGLINVKTNIEPSLVVIGLENELSEVILNLIKNACEAMPDGGILRVSLKARMGSILLQITDTGHGISQDMLSKIFSPFFTTKGTAGTGIGLATCREIVEKHNGSISVSSTVGQMTTFTVALPDHS